MSTTITWLGHATFLVETGGERVLIDPFLDDNPAATVKASEVEADWLLITHGHFDHMADAVAIATRTGARVVANFEVCNWLQRKGVDPDKTVPINPGGGTDCSFGRVTMTIAHHSSSLPDGSYGGVAGGLVLDLAEGRVYFAGDTALFLDMKLIGLKKARHGGAADRRQVHDGPGRCTRGGEVLEPQAGLALPLQHNATDRAGRRRLG